MGEKFEQLRKIYISLDQFCWCRQLLKQRYFIPDTEW